MPQPEITEREERLEEALWRIAQWADAYPLKVFPAVTKDYAKRAHEVLTANGMTLDRLSADTMRHVIQGVGKIATEALTHTARPAADPIIATEKSRKIND